MSGFFNASLVAVLMMLLTLFSRPLAFRQRNRFSLKTFMSETELAENDI
jgi:hypothetical protein